MNRIRVVVADPLRIFRTGVHRLLARETDFAVTEAASLADLLVAVDRGCPDLALIDLDLPSAGGVEAARILAQRCSTQIVVWGLDPTREQVLAAAQAGAHGFLRKEISSAGLVRALRGATQGEAPVARDLMAVLLDALHGSAEKTKAVSRAGLLSAREREVLGLVASGARNRQIADQLTISEFTVKRHVQSILQKLELPSRRAAAALYHTAYGVQEAPLAAQTAS